MRGDTWEEATFNLWLGEHVIIPGTRHRLRNYYFLNNEDFRRELWETSLLWSKRPGKISPSNDILLLSANVKLFKSQAIFALKTIEQGTSPVILWLRIRLPMQGTQFWPLIWADPPHSGATEPVHGNYWAHCALETALRSNMSRCREKPAHRNEEQPSLATYILTVRVLNGPLCVSCTPCLTHTPVVIWCKT